jgi:hypothetical protein
MQKCSKSGPERVRISACAGKCASPFRPPSNVPLLPPGRSHWVRCVRGRDCNAILAGKPPFLTPEEIAKGGLAVARPARFVRAQFGTTVAAPGFSSQQRLGRL